MVFSPCFLVNGIYGSGQAWVFLVHHGCSSGLLGPHPPTIHYTLPCFILKDPGLELKGNPQKQGIVRDNDKSKDQLRAHERRITPPQDLIFRYQWDSISSHKTSKLCMLHTRPCGTPTPTTHQLSTFKFQEKLPLRFSFPYDFPLEFHPLYTPDPPQLTHPPISSGTRFTHCQGLP